jgi:hypothetical protein
LPVTDEEVLRALTAHADDEAAMRTTIVMLALDAAVIKVRPG